MSTLELRPTGLILAVLPLLLAAAPLVSACGDDRVQRFEEPPPPEPRCGDGERNGEEQCEGEDLGGATCQSQGFIAGTLTCATDCSYDTSSCVRTCGNGRIDFGEECDGENLNGESCGEWGTLTCGADCRLLRTGCVSAPLKEAQRLDFLSRAAAAFGPREVNRAKRTELWVTQQNGVVDLIPWSGDLLFDAQKKRVLSSFGIAGAGLKSTLVDLNGDGQSDALIRGDGETKFAVALSRTDGFDTTPLELACAPLPAMTADLDGDGDLDVVAPACLSGAGSASEVRVLQNRKGEATPLLAQAESVTLAEPAAHFAVLDADRDQKPDLLAHVPSKQGVALWKGDGSLGFGAASTALLAEGEVPGAFAALDADQDGDVDLLVVDAAGEALSLLVNKGDGTFTRTAGISGLTAARALTVLDVDLDGWPDVALLDDTQLVVVQNAKGDFASRSVRLPLGKHTASSLAAGDADQDGDADLATSGVIEGTTRGEVVFFRNQVR